MTGFPDRHSVQRVARSTEERQRSEEKAKQREGNPRRRAGVVVLKLLYPPESCSDECTM